MDPAAVLRPRGPLPPSTYWLRRAVVLGAVLLLLMLVLRACGGDDETTPRDTASPAASEAPSDEPTPSETPSGQTATPTTPPAPVAAACAPAVLQVEAVADRPAYRRPSIPRLSLAVRNGGRTPCRLDVGPAQLELRVVSGADRIWSSDDCAPGGAPQVVTLPPGGVQRSTVAWPLRRSRPGCPDGQAGAQPGTYRVIGRVGTVTREGAAFRLE